MRDAGGGDLVTMAFAHLNGSTPSRHRVHSVDFGNWVTWSPVSGQVSRHGAFLVHQSNDSGVGMTLIDDQLGDPIYDLAG